MHALLPPLQLWDVTSGVCMRSFSEHSRRAWSVHFSSSDPTRLASGSDDSCVKLWSINEVRRGEGGESGVK